MKNCVSKTLPIIFFCIISAASANEESIYINFNPQNAISGGWWIAPISSIIALGFAAYFYLWMMKKSPGNKTMTNIASHIKEGAKVYLAYQYKTVAIIFIILSLFFSILVYIGYLNFFVPIAFLTGGFFSALCGYIGMMTATSASSRTTYEAGKSLNRGLKVAFRSGAVMGLVVVGFGLLYISVWYYILTQLIYSPTNMLNGLYFMGIEIVPKAFDPANELLEVTTTMLPFGMGASVQALFARVGGGIFTKAADVGADLVGKVEAGIPEDDPRNPATIADNVGDNVGDVAGMGADLYESYCGSILAAIALGAIIPIYSNTNETAAITAPMIIAGLGILISIIGIFLVRCKDNANMRTLLNALGLGTWGSCILLVVALLLITWFNIITLGILGSVVAGLVSGAAIGGFTEFYTSDEYSPTKGIAKQAELGVATTIIDGFAVGMFSSAAPIIIVVMAIACSYISAGGLHNVASGLYGISLAAVGMLATLGITLATDAYGPIADNAGGNAEMAGLDPEIRKRTDALDMLGNTTAATGKGFAIGSAALTAMSFLAGFIMQVAVWSAKIGNNVGGFSDEAFLAANNKILYITDLYRVNLMNPKVIIGIFIGVMIVFVLCALTMKAVGRAAGEIVTEVRRQFKEIVGIMNGTGKPDYIKCIKISTKSAQKEMIIPCLLAILVPIVAGMVLGIPGIMGLLVGSLTTGFALACTLNNAGGAWDNAKKHIEKGNLGGKRLSNNSINPTHSAAVIGDTVGDPFKDTSGPSLNILIKLMGMICIVFAPISMKVAPIVQGSLYKYF
jgi:K(+)-stimulated pyrophosphate-energized sodium pump